MGESLSSIDRLDAPFVEIRLEADPRSFLGRPGLHRSRGYAATSFPSLCCHCGFAT